MRALVITKHGGPDVLAVQDRPVPDRPLGGQVLIHAAAGGVGIAATQIAKRHGAEVYGTASPSKHQAILGFGVDHAVDYRREGWERDLPKFDLIMDAVGGRSFRLSYNLLRA